MHIWTESGCEKGRFDVYWSLGKNDIKTWHLNWQTLNVYFVKYYFTIMIAWRPKFLLIFIWTTSGIERLRKCCVLMLSH
jgi:hypothetical protein